MVRAQERQLGEFFGADRDPDQVGREVDDSTDLGGHRGADRLGRPSPGPIGDASALGLFRAARHVPPPVRLAKPNKGGTPGPGPQSPGSVVLTAVMRCRANCRIWLCSGSNAATRPPATPTGSIIRRVVTPAEFT